MIALYALSSLFATPFLFAYLWKRGGARFALGRLFPAPCPKGAMLYHAVSLGEAKLALALAKKSSEKIHLTISTKVAFDFLEKERPAFCSFSLAPLDNPLSLALFFRKGAPKALVFIEGDLWPLTLRMARAPLFVVSGKLSESSFKRLQKIPLLARWHFSPISHFFLQSEVDRDRLACFVKKDRLSIAGNLKIDFSIPKAPAPLPFKPKKLIVAISTHGGEEALIFEAISPLLAKDRELVIAFAPRRPERFKEVIELFGDKAASWSSKSLDRHQIWVVDAMGVAPSFYASADLAIIGGSFILGQVGGHSPIEPIGFGVPVLFGPEMSSQRPLVDYVKEHKLGAQLSEVKALGDHLLHLIEGGELLALRERVESHLLEKRQEGDESFFRIEKFIFQACC